MTREGIERGFPVGTGVWWALSVANSTHKVVGSEGAAQGRLTPAYDRGQDSVDKSMWSTFRQ